MKKKIILIVLVVLVVFVAGAYRAYDSIFQKAGSIKQSKVSEVANIYIYDNGENEIEMSGLEMEDVYVVDAKAIDILR